LGSLYSKDLGQNWNLIGLKDELLTLVFVKDSFIFTYDALTFLLYRTSDNGAHWKVVNYNSSFHDDFVETMISCGSLIIAGDGLDGYSHLQIMEIAGLIFLGVILITRLMHSHHPVINYLLRHKIMVFY